jgi:hypothetical protein
LNAAQHPAAAEKGAENATAAAAAEKRITTDTDETQKTAAICIMRLFIGPQLSQARDSWPKSVVVVVLFPRLHSRHLHLKKEKKTGCGWQGMGTDAIGAISRRAL